MEYKITFPCHPQKVNELSQVFTKLAARGKIRAWSVNYRQGIIVTDNIRTVDQCLGLGATVSRYEPVFYKGIETIK